MHKTFLPGSTENIKCTIVIGVEHCGQCTIFSSKTPHSVTKTYNYTGIYYKLHMEYKSQGLLVWSVTSKFDKNRDTLVQSTKLGTITPKHT